MATFVTMAPSWFVAMCCFYDNPTYLMVTIEIKCFTMVAMETVEGDQLAVEVGGSSGFSALMAMGVWPDSAMMAWLTAAISTANDRLCSSWTPGTWVVGLVGGLAPSETGDRPFWLGPCINGLLAVAGGVEARLTWFVWLTWLTRFTWLIWLTGLAWLTWLTWPFCVRAAMWWLKLLACDGDWLGVTWADPFVLIVWSGLVNSEMNLNGRPRPRSGVRLISIPSVKIQMWFNPLRDKQNSIIILKIADYTNSIWYILLVGGNYYFCQVCHQAYWPSLASFLTSFLLLANQLATICDVTRSLSPSCRPAV